MFGWSPLPRSAHAAVRDASSSKSFVRLSAIGDLVRVSSAGELPAAGDELIRLAEHDGELRVRAAALVGLADARIMAGLPIAYQCARTEGSCEMVEVRRSALIALGELAQRGQEPYRQLVLDCLMAHNAPELRYQALVGAGQLLQHAELVPVLVRLMADSDPKFQDLACRVAEEQWFAVKGRSVPEALEQAVRQLLEDQNDRLRTLAAIVLAERGGRTAEQCLVEAINGRNRFSEPADEQAAVQLCGLLGLEGAVSGLQRRLGRRLLSRAPSFEYHARIALARLNQVQAIEQILRGLRASSRWTRTRSAAAAGVAGVQRARPILTIMLQSDPRVDRTTVEEALRALDAPKSSLVTPSVEY